MRFLAGFAGYAILFYYLTALFFGLYRNAAASPWQPERVAGFLGRGCFRNVFFLLMLVWMPVLVLSYPGNLCYDCLSQIMQGLGYAPYSAHHPLLHTLIVSGIIKIIGALTGSRDLGLFVYILLQAAALAAALAGTVARMGRRGVSCVLRFAAVGIYVLAPMYSNMASTALKDIPFVAAVIWYLLLLEEMVAGGAAGMRPWQWARLVLVQALVGLLRNNGIYLVVLTGIAFAVFYRRKLHLRETLTLLLCLAVIPFAAYSAGKEGLIRALSAERGSVAEMLSIPFQQTARYLQLYRHELKEEERLAIEGVLGDVEKIAGVYDPDISDPVKALYRPDAGGKRLAAYFGVWFRDFFRHPAVYADAFLAHVYGWFDPGVQNVIRYEAETDLFGQGGLIPGADKVLLFVYRFAAYIPFLSLLENVGVYTWMLFLLAVFAMRDKRGERILLAPLFVSLLICMASPCFYLHPRYAYPIMFTLPFFYGIMSGRKAGAS